MIDSTVSLVEHFDECDARLTAVTFAVLSFKLSKPAASKPERVNAIGLRVIDAVGKVSRRRTLHSMQPPEICLPLQERSEWKI
jgi:hypothetical protein